MVSTNDTASTKRFEYFHHGVADLLGEPLLYLQPLRKAMDEPRDLRQAHYLSVARDVADRRGAVEGEHVVRFQALS